MNWVTIHRVCGEIAVARSIGDMNYKGLNLNSKLDDDMFRWPDQHNQVLRLHIYLLKFSILFFF